MRRNTAAICAGFAGTGCGAATADATDAGTKAMRGSGGTLPDDGGRGMAAAVAFGFFCTFARACGEHERLLASSNV